MVRIGFFKEIDFNIFGDRAYLLNPRTFMAYIFLKFVEVSNTRFEVEAYRSVLDRTLYRSRRRHSLLFASLIFSPYEVYRIELSHHESALLASPLLCILCCRLFT
jgi:hypothetical protein